MKRLAVMALLAICVMAVLTVFPGNRTSDESASTRSKSNASATSFADGTACAASRNTSGILITPASEQELAATHRTPAELEARVGSSPVLSAPGVEVRAYLAEVTNPSPAVGALVNRPAWVVEVSGFRQLWGGAWTKQNNPTSAIVLTHWQDVIDDATGNDLFALACP